MQTATMADVIEADTAAPSQSLVEQPPASRVATQTGSSLTTPGDLLRLAAQNGADIGMLERLLDLQQRFEEREAQKAMVKAMSAFKREPIEIYKRKGVGYTTKDGDFVGYKHAQLSDVTDAIAPAMARHGLSFSWDVQQSGNQITVTCVVTHELGHSKQVTMTGAPDTSGKKNLIQQVASTVTYLQRYTLLAVTGMSTKDEDDDGSGGADGEPEGTQQSNSAQSNARAAQQSGSVFYDQAKFDANKANWKEIVKSGRKTTEAMIQFIESKGVKLTDKQKEEINKFGDREPGEDDK